MSAASATTQRLAKPQLRNLATSYIRKHFVLGGIFSVSCAAAYWVLVLERRKKAYRDFYANYDADVEFEKMRATGVFQSAPADS